MSTPYIGQIQAFAFGIVPKGWAQCNGQTLAINQNQALFALLGTTYGGNGQTTFMLPNLQGQTPLGFASAFPVGLFGGEANHSLLPAEMPSHIHQMVASSASTPTPPISPISGGFPGTVGSDPGPNFTSAATTTLGTGSSPAGAGQGHENMQPYTALNFCIALQGIYPPRN